MDPAIPPRPTASPHSTAHAHTQPLAFAPDAHARFRGVAGSQVLSPLDRHALDGLNSATAFRSPAPSSSFSSTYSKPPSGAADDAVAGHRGFTTTDADLSADSPAAADTPRVRTVSVIRTSTASAVRGRGPSRGMQLPTGVVEEPPDLLRWRQRLFDLEEVVVLGSEEYETYFPWIDNVYSHRSTQEYKRTALVTRYYDCRLKGRPSGTQKSDDPNKKKRKRVARARDLCDVKIKITKYPAGSAAELRAGDGIVMDTKAREEALERIGDRPFWVMQRIDGSGTGGKPAAHRHSLADSDHIKPSTAHRQLAQLRKEAERNQKLSLWKPTGPAGATAKQHARAHGIKFYSACFCPFSQRVWIALEAKGIQYQYCEIYPLRKPKPNELLEANPRGLVPAIRQDEWACSESSVILEYLEDLDSVTPLYPTVPRLKANCRLWIDFINSSIVPSFYSVLVATEDEARGLGMEKLQRHIASLVQAADEKGPLFLGDQMCLVDVHLAPFALRLSRLPPFRNWPPPAPQSRWQQWLDALERNPHVCNTMSATRLYISSKDDLVKGFWGMAD